MSQASPKGRFVGFEALSGEGFAYYKLADGTVLGIKNVVVKIYRLLDNGDQPVSTVDGTPAYFFQTQNITQVLSPAEFEAIAGNNP